VKEYLPKLGYVVYTLAKCIDKVSDPIRKISMIFGLSAFAQLHFVDLHPFLDGNGRTCRVISKVLLDSILPTSIPMFENRGEYIASLEKSREVSDIRGAPLLLTGLLFRSAISHYNDILKGDKILIKDGDSNSET
jgi:hypothetical protein